jgi:hypothetical protein
LKKAYVVLAHEKPDVVVSLVERLLIDGSHVVLHYDKSSPSRDVEKFSGLVLSSRGRFMLAQAVAVRWGEWSVVRATLNALEQLSSAGQDFDYVTLISGSCNLSKPLQLFDEFLARNNGCEFIESHDAVNYRWVADGTQLDRWQYFRFFNWKMSPRRFYWSNRVQARLGVRRKLPLDMEPRIGSQWWTLTWSTLSTILDLVLRGSLQRFYRRTWIPDEHFFQTLVNHVVADKSRMVNFNLMQYEFDSWGNPRYFYNDNYCDVVASNKFFARKISPEADKLNKQLASVAGMTTREFVEHISGGASQDNPPPVSELSLWRSMPPYVFDLVEQNSPDNPGQDSQPVSIADKKYFVVIGFESVVLDQVRSLLNDGAGLRCHGRLFAREAIYFQPDKSGRSAHAGYTVAERDSNQREFFKRCLHDSEGSLVGFLVNPSTDIAIRHLLWELIVDPNSVVVAIDTSDVNTLSPVETAIDIMESSLQQVKPGSLLDNYSRMQEARKARENARMRSSISAMLDKKQLQLIRLGDDFQQGAWVSTLRSYIEAS